MRDIHEQELIRRKSQRKQRFENDLKRNEITRKEHFNTTDADDLLDEISAIETVTSDKNNA